MYDHINPCDNSNIGVLMYLMFCVLYFVVFCTLDFFCVFALACVLRFVVFLAAMSSSRSDIVTQSVRVFVFSCVPFFLLASLESVVHSF